MFSRKSATLLVAALTVGALGLAACGSSNSSSGSPSGNTGFNAAITSVVNPSTVSGGTLTLGASGDCDSWDPQRTYYAWCWDMQRLMSRTLMAYNSAPGASGATVVPDLATAAGTPNAAFTQWSYTMKSGIKFSDGTPVTTADVKYGIERLFATDVINGGPFSYFQCLLSTCSADGTAAYPGPYKDKSTTGLASIQTPTPTTITFTLNKPFTDFNDLMAFPAAAPVEQAKDTGANYQLKPLATGPFMISAYSPGKSVTFVRNPNWDQSTDSVRKPLVNQVQLTIFSDPDAEDARLLAGGIDLEADGGVQQAAQAKIMVANSTYKANADNPTTGFTRYLVVFQTVAPLQNKDCRLAIYYAINKTTLQLARGGSVTGGDIANTMLPPSFPGHDPNYNPYPDGSSNTGDLAMAKTELQKCGMPNGFAINMGYVNQGKGTKVFAATQAALARVGITVTGIASDQANYYTSFIGSPANVVKQKIGLAIAGWGPDYTSVSSYGFFNSISNSTAILPEGNTNYPSLKDPMVDQLLAKSISVNDNSQVQATSEALDKQIMSDAVYLPFVFDKTLYYRNPALSNIYLQAGLGMYYDYVQLGTGGK